jgi:hypothetical protein
MSRSYLRLAACALALVGATLAARGAAAQDQPAVTGKLALTIEYTGKGPVFDTPSISASSMPLSIASLSQNGGTHTFYGLPSEIYFAMAYDEKGGYDGAMGPPVQGTPIAIHGMTPAGTGSPVKTGGDDAVLKTTFDDSVRMP